MQLKLDKTAHEAIDGLGRKVRDYWHAVSEGRSITDSDIASAEQQAYASVLDLGMRVGLGALVVTFLVYALGFLAPHVPLDDLPRYWSMPVRDYLHAAHVPTGWGWLSLTGRGDFLNFVPIAFLSAVTVFCYARIVPILVAKRDRVFIGIVLAEIVVLLLAASGILAGGH